MAHKLDFNPEVTAGVVVSEYPRFDGAKWQVIDTLTGTTVLTSSGRNFFAANDINPLLDAYADDMQARRESCADTRRFIGEGNNGRVFGLGGSNLVVKEKRPGSHVGLQAELERMDILTDVIEKHCPRWITTPHSYSAYLPNANQEKQYLLMERIDHGVTVGDVLDIDSDPREKHLAEAVLNIFGMVTPDLKTELTTRYHDMHAQLTEAAYAEGFVPGPTGDILIDVKPYNVIIEPLATPIAGSNYRFTVIDQ